MSTKLSSFKWGNTKKWTVSFPYNVSAAVVKFRMAKTLDQDQPDLEITGVPHPDDAAKTKFTISAEESGTLTCGRYFAEHELNMNGEVYTFNDQDDLKVNAGVPKAI